MTEEISFAEAIKQGDLDLIRSFPKSDLHNHFVLGGCREFIIAKTGYVIEPVSRSLGSMNESGWLECRGIGCYSQKRIRDSLTSAVWTDNININWVG